MGQSSTPGLSLRRPGHSGSLKEREQVPPFVLLDRRDGGKSQAHQPQPVTRDRAIPNHTLLVEEPDPDRCLPVTKYINPATRGCAGLLESVQKGVLSICTGGPGPHAWSDEWVREGGEEEVAECVRIQLSRF